MNSSKRRKIINNRPSNNKALNTIIGMYYFIPLLLYFYKDLSSEKIVGLIKYLIEKKKYDANDFNTTFRASLKLLHKDKYLNKHVVQGVTSYSLTEKGYRNINDLLNSVEMPNRTKLYDKIRFDIIKEQYYN